MTSSHAFVQEEERITRAWVLGIMVAFMLIVTVLTIVAVSMLQARHRSRPLAETVPTKPSPAAEVSNIRSDLFEQTGAGTQLKKRQHAELTKFRWVDRSRGVVALPIDVAIQVVASEQK
jgi:hypothetical protein